jgi:polysaccharide deacetylase 2 family uncharacterized protein YibQ
VARRPLRAGRRLSDDDVPDVPIWRTAPALVAYGLVTLLVAGVAFLQLTYETPAAVDNAASEDVSATVALTQANRPSAQTPPPVEDDEEVSSSETADPAAAGEGHGAQEDGHAATPPPRMADAGHGEKADAGHGQTPAPSHDTPQSGHRAVPPATDHAAATPAAPQTAVPASALPALPRKLVLPPAPDPALQVAGRFGPLPTIGEDGRAPWQVYARPFPQERDRPRIAILLQDLGLSREQTNAAIQQLPGAIALGFTPYARDLADWIALSRAAGHEVLLQIPMEPFDFPTSDPGPHTLLTSAGADQNQERLEFLLSRVSGYVGVYNRMGDRFTSSTESMRPILQVIQERGLMFLDARTSGTSVAGRIAADLHLPHALNNRELDQVASRVEIDAKLIDLENIARQEGHAVGIARPYPVTIERLAQWAATLEEKGIDLAPVSAIAAGPAHR